VSTTTLEYIKAASQIVLGAAALWIAVLQWRGNRLKLTMDRYDRRLRVYQRTVEFLSLATRDFKVPPQEEMKFRWDTAEAEFLFGPEVSAYLKELAKVAGLSYVAHLEYRDMFQEPPAGYDHKKVTDEMHKHSRWLTHQHEVINDKFRTYLNISQQ
jgi:hypothetical protein